MRVFHTGPCFADFVGLGSLACRRMGPVASFLHAYRWGGVLQQEGERLRSTARVISGADVQVFVEFWSGKILLGRAFLLSCFPTTPRKIRSCEKGSDEADTQLFVLLVWVMQQWEGCQILILFCSRHAIAYNAFLL